MRFTGFVAKVVAIVVFLTCTVFMPLPKTSNAYVGWVGAAGSPYIGSAATQPMDINVSNNNGDSYLPSFKLDKNNKPGIAWQDKSSGNWEIYYATFDGLNWVNANGEIINSANCNVSINSTSSEDPSLAFDSEGHPWIAWEENKSNTEIYLAHWDGTQWVNIHNLSINDTNGSISNGSQNSTYYGGRNPSLVLDKNDFPCVATDFGFTRWDGNQWVNARGQAILNTDVHAVYTNYKLANLDTNPNMNYQYDIKLPSLVLDNNNQPQIALTSWSGYGIIYIKWDNNWVNSNGDISDIINSAISGSENCREPSLKINRDGYPCISWWGPSTNDYNLCDIFYACWNGEKWTNIKGDPLDLNNGNISINNTHSSQPFLVFDNDWKPNIVWQNQISITNPNNPSNTKPDIFYVKWNGVNWVNVENQIYDGVNANISNNVTGSSYPIIDIGSNSNPHIVWIDQSQVNRSNEIYYVQFANSFDGTFNITKSVDTNGDGDYSDSGKNVAAGDTLSYKINWKFNQGQDALENPYLYDTIPDGTTYVSGSASPTANISYSTDGGATWIAGEPPNGSPAGTQLRWDLSSLWVGAAGSPYVGSAATQPMDINVSRNLSNSTDRWNRYFQLDTHGYPHIVWVELGTYTISYVKWNGLNWVNANNIYYNPILNNAIVDYNGDCPQIVLDSYDRPNIVFHGNRGSDVEIIYIKWNGVNWVNNAGILYDGNNANVSNDSVDSVDPVLALDSFDNPHIVWLDDTNDDVIYIYLELNKWKNAYGLDYDPTTNNGVVSMNNGECHFPFIAVNKFNEAGITWETSLSGNYDIFFIRIMNNNIYNISNVVYDGINGNISNDIYGNFNQQCEVIFDTSGNANIIWHEYGDVYFIKWEGNQWFTINDVPYVPNSGNANITNTPGISDCSSIQLDSENYPHVTWFDNSFGNNDIYYIKWNGVSWITAQNYPYSPISGNANISKNLGDSLNPHLELDVNDNPHLLWTDSTLGNNEIYYIQQSDEQSFTFSVKIDNPPTSYGMCNHATFRHKWDNDSAIESNEVCNTIKFNYTGTFTLEKGVDSNGDGKYTDNGSTVTPGTTLGYKLDWTFDNPNNDPLNGAYIYDTVPLGTKYMAGSSPTFNLSYSTDNGFSWLSGEPPDGSAAGTILRWKLTQPGWTNAQGQLVNSTNPNMSKNTGISDFPSLAVYKDGHPSIAWSDDVLGTTMVYYAKWNGSQWVNAAGLPFTAANGNVAGLAGGDPSLALDPITGNPWIAFQSNGIVFTNLEIHVVKWNGSQWTNSAGMPATLVNSNVSNNAGLSWFPSQLVLDSKGYPCIVWKDNTTGSFQNYFARWNGTNWTNAAGTVLNTTNGSMNNNVVNSFWPTVSLDANDRPYVAWDNNFGTNFEVYFAKWDGTQWVTASGTPLTPTNGNISNNTGSSQIPFLFTDRVTGNPCIAWSDDTPGNYEIYFAKWNGSAWVNASNVAIDSTNPNMSHTSGGSYLLSLALDFNNLPAISWEDDTTGNSEIYYSKWNGSAWANAKGDAFTAANGIVNTSPARSWFPSLAFDPVTNNPNIAWLDKTPGNNEVYFAKWTDYHQTFTFSVIVDKPFSVPALSPICNSATFSHAFDGGNPLSSNSVCMKVKGASEVKGANLVIRKTAKSLQYNPKDTFVFQITVANNGSTAAENVVLTDNFPNELVFDSSTPSGQTGLGRVKFSLGTLAPNTSASFTLKFKLSPKTTIDDCITVINEAIAASGTLIAKDTAAINICTPKAPCELYIDTKWTNVIKGVRVKGETVKLEVIPRCGSSPYSVTIDWGDGSTNSGTVEGEGESYISGHSFPDTGDFTVKITCVDAYGSTRIVTKTLK